MTSGGRLTPYRVDIVIASGTAATRPALTAAGVLDEGLFIDLVDTDWCLRCRAHGVPIRVVPEAVMRHSVAPRPTMPASLACSCTPPYAVTTKFAIACCCFASPDIPFLFALRETVGIVVSRVLLLFFVANRSAYLRAYLSAIKDGLAGVTGRRPE